MTFREIYGLACTFVPERCRKNIDEDHVYSYWPAHEIGHFLVANKAEVRREEYGLEAQSITQRGYVRAIVHELAAMHVSTRLVWPISRRLVKREIDDTDELTLDLRDDPQIIYLKQRLLERNGVMRVPREVNDLRRLLRRKHHALGLS